MESSRCFEVLPVSTTPRAYRFYCYDGARRDLTFDLIEASSDEVALAYALAACPGVKYELWDGHRLVAQMSEEHRAA
jgi:hypothetical protein